MLSRHCLLWRPDASAERGRAALGSTRAALGRSDLALAGARARARSRRSRVLQFAVCSCNAAHAVTQLAHPRTTSAGQSVVAARLILVGLAGTLCGCCCHTGTLLSRASTRQLTRAHICKLSRHKLQRWASLRPSGRQCFQNSPNCISKKKARRPWIPPAASSARDR